MAELLAGLRERDPASLLDLVVVVLGVAFDELEQEERDRLRDRLPVAPVPVARLAQLVHRLGHDPGLLAHLARRRLDRRLAGIYVPLRQRQHLRAVRCAARRHDHDHLLAAYDHAAGRALARGTIVRVTTPFARTPAPAARSRR